MLKESQSDSLKEMFKEADFLGKTGLVLATWFGTGFMPVAPGTFGSIAAIPLVFCLNELGVLYGSCILVMVIGIGIWAGGKSEKLLGRNDPSEVVIDEVAGFLLTMFLLPSSWQYLVLGFFLFRFFDILKPYPIKKTERLRGGLGIVMDDLVAGLYAHLGLRIILLVMA